MQVGQTPVLQSSDGVVKSRFSFDSQSNLYFRAAQPCDVPSGHYHVLYSSIHGWCLSEVPPPDHDMHFTHKSPTTVNVQRDLDVFWNSSEAYAKASSVHKRGILLHGPPGTGKSHIIYREAERVIGMGGVCVKIHQDSSICGWADIASSFRAAFPGRPVCLVLEELDGYCREAMSALLSVLDGPSQITGLVAFAATNKASDLPLAITDRPGRFDRSYFVDVPDYNDRRQYAKEMCERFGVPADDALLEEISNATAGMSIAHIKEVIVSMSIYNYPIEEVIEHMTGMKAPKMPNGKAVSKAGFSRKPSQN